MRYLLLTTMLAACGGDDTPDPHDEIDCGPSWTTPPKACERACAPDPGTFARSCSNGTVCELGYKEVDGVAGCCNADGVADDYVVRWVECE